MTHDHFSPVHHGLSTVKRLALAIGLTVVFIAAEIVAGIFAKSLALLTDAVHNVTDVIALGLTWWAFWITTKPAHSKMNNSIKEIPVTMSGLSTGR